MTGVIQDLRYGLRGLVKNPGFTVVAVLSLALGVGANTTIFTLVRALFLRPFPVRDPGTLVAVFTADDRAGGVQLLSYPNYRDYRDHNTVFSSLVLYLPVAISLTGHGDPQQLVAQLVSGNYFDTLGVTPTVGRGFRPEEDAAPGAAAVAVISHALWKRLYAGDPRVNTRSIELNGRPYSIVGVAPPGFAGLNQLLAADVFLPFSTYPVTFSAPTQVLSRRAQMFAAVARLKPGLTLAQAEAGTQSLARELERQYPLENQGRRLRLMPITEASMDARTRSTVQRAGTVLMVISSLVLLIGCGNVANLLLARAAGRSKEIALRLATGASRTRLVRQLVTESLLLAVLSGAAGFLVARWACDLLWSLRGPTFEHAGFQLDLDFAVLSFNAGVALITGLLFGLAPALHATKRDLVDDLKERAATGSLRFHGVGTLRSLLVVAQVTLAVVTLVGASLFVRSLLDATHINPGFDAANLAVIAYNVNDQGYNEERGRDYHARALEAAAAVPGVAAAALSRDLPFRVSGSRGVIPEGTEVADPRGRQTLTQVVTPGYFRTLGIPLLRGRDFNPLDTKTSPRVVIVNEIAAAVFWPGENAVGKRISFLGEGLPVEVVGVARTTNYRGLGEPPQPLVYLSLGQYYFPTVAMYVRTTGDPGTVIAAVRRALQPLERNLPLQPQTLDASIRDLLWSQRLSALLLSAFGFLALLLALVGIYGVIAYSVQQRRREMGIRMALGATPTDVQFMVLGEGIRLITIGVIAGSIIGLAVAGTVESMLFLKSSRDMFTFTLVPATLTLAGVLACWAPAVSASRADPADALRDE
jgi:predicted permease